MAACVTFDQESARGADPDPRELGGKGANLVTLCRLGLPVPPGFILGTATARKYLAKGRLTAKMVEQVRRAVRWLEERTGRRFGSSRKPLLLAVRSGAPESMPGMMDTILNVGLNDESVEGLARFSGNPRFAWDSYRRLIMMYGESVLGVPRALAEDTLARCRRAESVEYDWELDAASLRRLTKSLLSNLVQVSGREFFQDPEAQLFTAIEAVLASWNAERCRAYREMHGLPETGTAVTVQAMVFGNSGGNSGSGVAFSRDPSTGENRFYSEFLYNAQGEDVVSGARSPEGGESLQVNDPEVYRQIRAVARQLEVHFRDMQDLEFTVEDGRLYLLQARRAKRSPLAAVRVAAEMAEEGLITPREALERVAGIERAGLRRERLAPPSGTRPAARGIPASAGVAVGEVALSSEAAMAMRRAGRRPILVRQETQAEDVRGLEASAGLLTARGGRTSHAAVVARQLGITAVVGCRGLEFWDQGRVTLGGEPLREGQVLSLDGDSGGVYAGEVEATSAGDCPGLEKLRRWAHELEVPFAL